MACLSETRIGLFDFSEATRTEPPGYVSGSSHRASVDSCREVPSDLELYTQTDPLGVLTNENRLRLFPARQVGPVAAPSPGGNVFLYADANPRNLIDPTGEQAVAWALPAAAGCAIADGPLPIGDVIGAILLAGAVIYDAAQSRTCDRCETPRCKPCIPPVGTLAYRGPETHRHWPFPVGQAHYHNFEMHQSPPEAGCICFWHPLGESPQTASDNLGVVPSGATPQLGKQPCRGGVQTGMDDERRLSPGPSGGAALTFLGACIHAVNCTTHGRSDQYRPTAPAFAGSSPTLPG